MILTKIISLKNRNRDLSKKIKHITGKITMLNYKHSDVKLSFPHPVMTVKEFNTYLTWIEEVDKLKEEMNLNSNTIIYWRTQC